MRCFRRKEQNPSLHHGCSESHRSRIEVHPLARNSPKDWKWALVTSQCPELTQRCRGLSGYKVLAGHSEAYRTHLSRKINRTVNIVIAVVVVQLLVAVLVLLLLLAVVVVVGMVVVGGCGNGADTAV